MSRRQKLRSDAIQTGGWFDSPTFMIVPCSAVRSCMLWFEPIMPACRTHLSTQGVLCSPPQRTLILGLQRCGSAHFRIVQR